MKKGDKVHWHRGGGEAEGIVHEKFKKPVTKKIKGTQVKRNGSKETPAYLIEQKDGDKVLKSEREIQKGGKK